MDSEKTCLEASLATEISQVALGKEEIPMEVLYAKTVHIKGTLRDTSTQQSIPTAY